MNWIEFQRKDLLTFQPADIVVAIENAAEQKGESNPIPDAIEAAVLEIRAAVKSGNYKVDADRAKIPAELKKHCAALVMEFARQKIMTALSADEIRLANAARELLAKIADGEFAVSMPDNPESAAATAQTSAGPTVVISQPSKLFPASGRLNF